MEEQKRIAALIVKKLKGELDSQEAGELNAWASDSEANRTLYEQLTHPDLLQPEVSAFYQSRNKIFDKVQAGISAPKVISLWKKISAVAAVFFVLLASGYWLLIYQKQADVKHEVVVKTKDIEAPQSTRATITLANGNKIYLDSATNGTLATQGNIKLVKLANGQIAYSEVSGPPSGDRGSRASLNTLTNPRRSKVIDMILADDSHVWLNAGSSITYPVAFVGNERKVSMTGEAYFEIKPLSPKGGQSKIPFIVSKGEVSVQVLGTHFNVNAYEDEEDIKVTLLEGSVKVLPPSPKGGYAILKPGQQAQVSQATPSGDGGRGSVAVKTVDVDAVVAWRNGFFSFHSADIPTVMRQLARWYDVEVAYTSGIPKREFEGSIDRSLSLAKVLAILEKMKVHFKIEDNKKILIVP